MKKYFDYVYQMGSHSLSDDKQIVTRIDEMYTGIINLKMVFHYIAIEFKFNSIHSVKYSPDKMNHIMMTFEGISFTEEEKLKLTQALGTITDMPLEKKFKLYHKLHLEEMVNEDDIQKYHSSVGLPEKRDGSESYQEEPITIDIIYYDMQIDAYDQTMNLYQKKLEFDFFDPDDLYNKGIRGRIIKVEPKLNFSNKFVEKYGERVALLIDGFTVMKIAMAATIYQKEKYLHRHIKDLREIVDIINNLQKHYYKIVVRMEDRRSEFGMNDILEVTKIGNALCHKVIEFFKHYQIINQAGIINFIPKLRTIYQALTQSLDAIR